MIHENRREREGCQNRVNYRDRRAQGQTLFLPIYGAPDSNSLIFGEHCAQRKPKHDELMAGFTFHPLALQLLATSLLLDRQDSSHCRSYLLVAVFTSPWNTFQEAFDRPLHKGRSPHRVRPLCFFCWNTNKKCREIPQKTANRAPSPAALRSFLLAIQAHSPKLKADPPKLSRALLTSNSPNLTLNRAESLTISK